MATSIHYFSGKSNWAKLRVPDTKFNPEGVYTIDVYLDENEIKKFHDTKLQLKLRTNDEGTYVTFKRPVKKLIKGDLVELGAPEIKDKDGEPYTGDIGNGSTVTVKVKVYDTMKGKGHTLEAIRVDNLVEYVRAAPDEGQPF